MINEFDFDADDMDEKVVAKPVPQGLNQSLNVSRFKQENMLSHRKTLHDLYYDNDQTANKENERMRGLKEKEMYLRQEMIKPQPYKSAKMRQIEEEQKQKVLKEYTFRPKINQKGPKRNFNEFLEKQNAHTQKVKDKCEQLKKNLQDKKEKATYKPKINSNSNIQQKRENQENTVFERLYSLSEKEKYEQGETNSFHPVINARSKNLVRDGPVQEILYEDARRRQEKGSEVLQASTFIEKVDKTNYNNDKYAAQKFIREYFFALEALQIDTSSQFTIEYVVFNQLLKKLGFVTIVEDPSVKSFSTERSLVHDAYQLLTKTKMNARNVCVFLLALIGIYHINPVNFDEGDEPQPESDLNFDEAEGRKLQKHFNLFYRNRLSSEPTRKTDEKTEGDSYSFHPSINKQSAEMAQKYRSTMIEEANEVLQQYPELEFNLPEDGVISHTQLLVLTKMAKDLKKEKQKEERYDDELKECTFKPLTITSSLGSSKATEFTSNAGFKKSTELYEYHKQAKSKKDSLVMSRHNEQDPECTFKPQINRVKPPKLPQVPFSKQTDETLFRLHKGRQEHEEKTKLLERGEKIRQRKEVSKQAPQVPSLILDVNLGEKTDKIVLYRGDEARLEQIAEEFGSKHGLDSESEGKLLEMLQTELHNVLQKIEEDNESEDYDN